MSGEASARERSASHDAVLYRTASVCPQCMLLERRGIRPVAAEVRSADDGRSVVLRVLCQRHACPETLVCSDVSWYKHVLSFAHPAHAVTDPVEDIEDLWRLSRRPTSRRALAPLVIDIPILASSTGSFLALDEIKQLAAAARREDVRFDAVYRVAAKTVTDIPALNAALLTASDALGRSSFLLVDASFDRLLLLARLTNSVMLRPRVYPQLRYYLRRGSEQQCESEIRAALAALADFTGIRVLINICVEAPWPQLQSLLAYLRSLQGRVPLIVFTLARSQRDAFALVQRQARAAAEHQPVPRADADPLPLIQHLCQASGDLRVSDFLPACVAQVSEPLWMLLGYGRFSIRPSPFCSFAVPLLNTPDLMSVPATRKVDLAALYRDAAPLLHRISRAGTLGLLDARQLKTMLARHVAPGVELPDLLALIRQSEQQKQLRGQISNTQILLIHNTMDLTTYDAVRRCDCASVQLAEDGEAEVAACTRCL